MSELKGFAAQDPMKGEQDISKYNNEFKDLQLQLFNISEMTFNGVSLFANYVTAKGSTEVLFNAQNQNLGRDNTISIFTKGTRCIRLEDKYQQVIVIVRFDLKD